VLRLRRKESAVQRLQRRGRELRQAAPQLDIPWARSWVASTLRELFLRFVLQPIMGYYTRRRATGRDKLSRLKGPVILVANHCSHIDTPVILAALPRRLRRRTVVAAAADYFYRNRLVATLVSLIFNTVPIDRKGGGLDKRAADHVDRLLDKGWNLLLYPEGTRSRSGGTGRLRRGAAVLAARHDLPIVPICVTGTREAMPPGRFWPSRLHGKLTSRRRPISISFGDPISPTEDASEVIQTVQRFFDGGNGSGSNGAGTNGHGSIY
jgi:1-acyl-sn-glycerol-3-phosphate acyltransferase